jgi:hypothetical protein
MIVIWLDENNDELFGISYGWMITYRWCFRMLDDNIDNIILLNDNIGFISWLDDDGWIYLLDDNIDIVI